MAGDAVIDRDRIAEALTTADRKRLAVLRRINDVFGDPTGSRLYDSSSVSRSVRAEVRQFEAWNLIERYVDDEDQPLYRLTAAGRDQLDAWEVAP